MKRTPVYGIMAEFDSASLLVDAAHRTHEAGYLKIDAYSPFPVEGLAEAMGFHKNRVPLVVLIGGLLGGLSGYVSSAGAGWGTSCGTLETLRTSGIQTAMSTASFVMCGKQALRRDEYTHFPRCAGSI